jgi:ankyrin repeat protein
MNHTDARGRTPLWIAAKEGLKEVVQVLLTYGAIVDILNADAKTPLWKAASNGHKEVLELLLAHGATVDAPGKVCAHPTPCPS